MTVDGTLSGLHRSPFHGYSAEFSQYRHYRPGDDLKYVDWKLFARTDRLYTKQFRETTNVRMQIVLDASASMGYRSDAGASKLEYARLLAAALAHLVAGQGDAAGLTVYDDQIRPYLASRPGRSHLRAVLAQLANTEPRGAPRRLPRSGAPSTCCAAAACSFSSRTSTKTKRRWTQSSGGRRGWATTSSIFHVLTPTNSNGAGRATSSSRTARPDDGCCRRRPPVRRISADGRAFVQRWRTRCTAAGIEYVLARTDAAPAHTLREYLLHRGPRGAAMMVWLHPVALAGLAAVAGR